MYKIIGRSIVGAAALLCATASYAAAVPLGKTSLTLVEGQASVLGLDLKRLEWEVCGNAFAPPIRGTVLVIASDGGGNGGDRSRLELELLSVAAGTVPGMSIASVVPVDFELLGGQVLALSCGRFLFSVRIDPHVSQPVSYLSLVHGDRTGTFGTCAGNVELQAILLLTPYGEIAPAYELPRSLLIQISGRWATVRYEVVEGTSPIVLLADQDPDGRVVPAPSCLTMSGEPDTLLCFAGTAPPAAPPKR